MAACAQQTVVVGSDSWAPSTYTITKDPVQVALPNANRRGVLIICTSDSPASCHITDRSTASISVGGRSYPLAIGEGVTINTTAAVWVIADNIALGCTIKVIEEFGTPNA